MANENWPSSTGQNVFEMIVSHGGPGLWDRRVGTGSESPFVVAAHTPRQRPQWAESRTKLQSNTISVSQLYAAAFIDCINSSQLFT